MRPTRFFTVAIALLNLLAGVTTWAGSGRVYAINTQGIQTLLKADSASVFLLDVRTPGEYRSGHIDGSVLIPMREVPQQLARIPRDKNVVVICASGARSGAVTDFLVKNGYRSVMNYTGGVFDWQRKGLPLTR